MVGQPVDFDLYAHRWLDDRFRRIAIPRTDHLVQLQTLWCQPSGDALASGAHRSHRVAAYLGRRPAIGWRERGGASGGTPWAAAVVSDLRSDRDQRRHFA